MEGSFGSLRERVIGSVVLLIGLACGVVGGLLLRRGGEGWRVGRLLAVAPQRSLDEAIALADSDPSYIRIHGRVDSDEEFPGDEDRPLVFRRRRLQRRGPSGWQTFDEERLAVPFALSDRGASVAIDVDALGDGLVVVPRLADGVAADLTAEAATGPLPEMAPDVPVRLRIEQVSSVDHATAGGVPRRQPDGSVFLGPGLRAPLIVTTLDPDEAMRLLASERRSSLLLAAVLLAVAVVAVLVGAVLLLLGR